jgi:hypothetical protein
MTPARRTARTCRTIALITTATALYSATHHPAYAIPGLTAAALLCTVATAYDTEDRRIRARHHALARAALQDAHTLGIPEPCCRFWQTTDGAHAPDCTRPDNPRTAA